MPGKLAEKATKAKELELLSKLRWMLAEAVCLALP